MRYIASDSGQLRYVSFGAEISCDDQTCTEYTGNVPTGYQSLESWYLVECEKLYRWNLVNGELTLNESATAPTDRARIALNSFNPFGEYMQLDKEGYQHIEPYCGSDGEVGFLIYNEDNVYILQMSQTGLLLRWYKDGVFVDYTLDGTTSADGVGIANVQQTTRSEEDDGDNVVTLTLTDGKQYSFTVQNGSKGSTGATGATGPQGEKGDTGLYYFPSVDSSGNLSWTPSETTVNGLPVPVPTTVNIKGPQGETGATGGGAASYVEASTPNTLIGNVGDFWYDTANSHFYICTAVTNNGFFNVTTWTKLI